jgi:biotin carboxylase
MAMWILNIGGGVAQIDLVRRAKEIGFRVAVTDMNPNAAAKSLADRFESISASDEEALLALAQDLHQDEGLIAVYGVANYALPAIGKIHDLLLPDLASSKVLGDLGDKSITKSILQKAGLPSPLGLGLNECPNDPLAWLNNHAMSFPIIIKPANVDSSDAIATVNQETDFKEAFEKARAQSTNVIVESLLKGRFYNVDIVMQEGQAKALSVTERGFVDDVHHQAQWGLMEAQPKENFPEFFELGEKACLALGYREGPITLDIILTSNHKPFILEMSPHLHSFRLNAAIGLDEALLNYYRHRAGLTSQPSPKEESFEYGSYLYLHIHENGRLGNLNSLEKVRQSPEFLDIDIRVKKGQSIKSKAKHFKTGAIAYFKSSDSRKLLDTMDQIRREKLWRMQDA